MDKRQTELGALAVSQIGTGGREDSVSANTSYILIEKRYSNRILQSAKRRLRYWLNNPDKCYSHALYLDVLHAFRSGYYYQNSVWELSIAASDTSPILLAIRVGWCMLPANQMNFTQWLAEFHPNDEYDWLLAIPLYVLMLKPPPSTPEETTQFREIFRDVLIRRPSDLKFIYPEIMSLSNQEVACLLPRLTIAQA